MIKDWRDIEVEIGDTVLYGVSSSNSIKMVEALVIEIVPEHEEPYYPGSSVTHYVEEKIRVKPISENRYPKRHLFDEQTRTRIVTNANLTVFRKHSEN